MVKNKKYTPAKQEVSGGLGALAALLDKPVPQETKPKAEYPEGSKAAYNFIPFSYRVLNRYPDPEQLPGHDSTDPKLLSGEIRLKMTAQTPVFVSDGNKTNPGFFRDSRGNYCIPGTSLRGVIRTNMEILGLGAARPGKEYDDYRLFFRDLTTVGGERRKYYHTALGITTENRNGKVYSVAKNVRSGYLHHEGNHWYIVPTKQDVFLLQRSGELIMAYPELERNRAFRRAVSYRTDGTRVSELRLGTQEGYAHGILLCPGDMNKQRWLYLFPEEDADGEITEVSSGDIISYQQDYHMKENGLKGTGKIRMDPAFWQLPKDGQSQAVFYVDYEGAVSFGGSRYLRLQYRNPLSAGVPEIHAQAAQEHWLDYPNAVLGFADEESGFRSRVRFGDLMAQGSPKPGAPISTMAGGPKPSYLQGYMRDGDSYNDAFTLNGRKQYWLKGFQQPPLGANEKMAVRFSPLNPGTVFTGTVYFRNLQPDELGLLLLCLVLEKDCCQSIGFGKNMGCGRMKPEITCLRFFRPEEAYQDFTQTAAKPETGRIPEYIQEFYQKADGLLQEQYHAKKSNLRKQSSIQTFFLMRSTILEDPAWAAHMELKQFRHAQQLPLARTILDAQLKGR